MPTNLHTDVRASQNITLSGWHTVKTTIASVLAALALTATFLLGSAAPASAAAAPTDFAGIGDWGYPTTAQSRQLSADGVRSVRAGLVWDWVEHTQGRRYWGGVDKLVGEAATGGYELVLVINGCAAWACGQTRVPPSTPEQKAAFQDFVGAAVRRYGAGGTYWAANPTLVPARMNWQVWNEVNVGQDWPNPTTGGYAEMLASTNATIKSVDPAARVVTAGLAELPAVREGAPLTTFLAGLEQDPSFRSSADVVAIHGYAESPAGVARILDATKRIMAQYGDTRPIWITELGWGDGGPAHPFAVDTARQAQNLRETYDMMVGCRSRWNLDRAIWFSLKDVTAAALGEADYWGMHTGLYAADGSPKPVAAAFREFSGGRELPGGRGAACGLGAPADATVTGGGSGGGGGGSTGTAGDDGRVATPIATPPPAPVASITRAPAALIGRNGDSSVSFAAEGAGGFQCAVSGGPWIACASPYNVPKAEGPQQVFVRALDTVGLPRTAPVSATWTTDLTPPRTIFRKKPAPRLVKRSIIASFATTVRVAVAPKKSSKKKTTGKKATKSKAPSATKTRYKEMVSQERVTYQCSLNKAAFRPCSASYRAKAGRKGKHVLTVRAVDAAGNVDTRGATATFTVSK